MFVHKRCNFLTQDVVYRELYFAVIGQGIVNDCLGIKWVRVILREIEFAREAGLTNSIDNLHFEPLGVSVDKNRMRDAKTTQI